MSQKTKPLNTLSSLLEEYKDKEPFDLITAKELIIEILKNK